MNFTIGHIGIVMCVKHSGVLEPKLPKVNIHIDSKSCEIDDTERWKVNKLKTYVCHRGLPVSAKLKKELCAPACAATVQKLLIVFDERRGKWHIPG